MKVVFVAGVLWPFVLAAGLFAALLAGVDVTDGLAYGTLWASLLGTPAVAVALYRSLPSGWSDDRRHVVAGMLVLPVVAAEVFFALCLFAGAMRSVGFVPA